MSKDLERLKKNWEDYVFHGILNEGVRPEIKEAWDRCLAYGVDPNSGYGQVLSEIELRARLEENRQLIQTAAPVMESLFEIIKKTSFSLVLTDWEGVLIHVVESENIHFKHNSLNFVLGTRWDEKNVGANAIGTALARNEAIHMIGSEHFCQSHHPWTCSAALIRNSAGKVIGCLDISGSAEDEHIHTFGIVSAAAKIIEKQLDLQASHELLDTAFNSVLDGLFMIDLNFRVTHMNDKVTQMFDMEPEQFLRLDMAELFGDLDIEERVFGRGKSIRISEYAIQIGARKLEGLLNISPTRQMDQITGAVIFLKEAYQVRKVVSQIAGFNAVYAFKDIITVNDRMLRLIDFSRKIAQTDCTVLIQGESGTGKELFAHSIHMESHRHRGPFIAINCAALPKDLVESELFGYEKGAFTGAINEGKPGKFELANGGTIFLDEVGELPLEIQSKLLRVLDNQKVTRIGGRDERHLNVRIIAATNRNLREEVDIKRFREDLFFRLNVINLTLIPLRERRDDILPLAEAFLEQLNRENSENARSFSDAFKESLLGQTWKGNVRELRHLIQREYYLSSGPIIHSTGYYEQPERASLPLESGGLREVERQCIIDALRSTRGQVLEAAARLNVGKSTIYRRIKEYDIDVKKFKQNEMEVH